MRRSTPILILSLLMTLFLIVPATASWFGSNSLVTIDGTKHTTEDFKRWWQYFNDSDMALPKTPELYIDWLLLSREGKRMHLEEDPYFQHKTEVFLKVRSLLLLRQEEVNSKIQVSDDELRALYKKRYTPIWQLERLQFIDEKTAKTAWQELKDGTVTIDQLETRPMQQGGPMSHREDWRRPLGMDKYWADVFRKLATGDVSEPEKDLDFYVVYYVKKREDGDAKDFDKLRKSLQERIWQKKQNELTRALISRLRKKFDVKVDEKRLADLDLNKPDDSYGDEPIITTNRRNFSEKEFMSLLRKDEEYRKAGRHGKPGNPDVIKNRVANGIIVQNVTNWEALDRHYEEREPFKWEYQFNVNHRLTNAAANRLFAAQATVSDEEIKDYYTKNISRYTQPEMVDLVLIKDKKGDVDRVWREIATGKDFFKVVKENTDQSTKSESLPFPHLEPAVQKIVAGLSKGETSQPFTIEGHRFLVHLTNRTPAVPVPLEKVTQNIRSRLRQEKIARKRNEYLELLKSKSEIKVNESNWQEVQKELGGTK
ncbi:MAG: peptidyl-prolyl cis-trans isomerase [Deltaproteobacteria bacterium]